MQNRVESKSRLAHYFSIKDYGSVKEQPKKQLKSTHTKSNKKHKLSKNNAHSQSKIKLQTKTNKKNENFNMLNIVGDVPIKVKSKHVEVDHVKKQMRKDDKSNRNSTQRLMKSQSAIRLYAKTSRLSPSPIGRKDQQIEDKSKTQRNVISRTDREKKPIHRVKDEKPITMKKSGSVATIHFKRQPVEKSTHNRVSVKTQISSKMNSVIREEERVRKGKKKEKGVAGKKQVHIGKNLQKKALLLARCDKKSQLEAKIQRSILYSEVSFQEFIQENPYESQLLCSDKVFLPSPPMKIKTQGCQLSREEHKFEQKTVKVKWSAAIKIQKVFRGFITRKYIDQARFVISKTIIIQNWWRKVLFSRQKKAKALSIESSLITIKDFNDTLKADKLKNLSGSKDNTFSNNKISNMKQFFKNILEESEQDQTSALKIQILDQPIIEQCQSPQKKVLTKEVYIEAKIKGQINSENVFNSPKCLNSPNIAKTPTNITFTLKDFFNNSNQKQKIKQILNSPRLKSPSAPKATPVSNKGKQSQQFQIYPSQVPKLEPFETNFSAIQQFCLLMVNFLRDHPTQLRDLLSKISSFKTYRSELILKNWNSYKLVPQSFLSADETLPLDYQYLQIYERPSLFSNELRQKILRFPEIQIELHNRRYDIDGERNRQIHRGYLHFVFDAMQEAFYHPFKHFVLQWRNPRPFFMLKDNSNMFENIFSNVLGQLFNWGQVLCGLMMEGPVSELEEDQLQVRRQQTEREKVMDKRLQHWDLGLGSRLGIKIEISQQIVQYLVQQLWQQLILTF